MISNCPFTMKNCLENCALTVVDSNGIRLCAITQIAVSLGQIVTAITKK